MTTYENFLDTKAQYGAIYGFEPIELHDFLYPFQRDLCDWAIRKGRAALFADCGLGKTAMQLAWADNVVRHTNKPVLILTPLAVSYQTCDEAEKFGIVAMRSSDGSHQGNLVIVTNYERLHKFNSDDFSGVVCDECFPPQTLVDTPLGPKHIETLVPGDSILNATGVDYVKAIAKRKIFRAVRIVVRGRNIVCSKNHPFLTVHGWRRASDLRTGDYLMETAASMCVVRQGVCPEVLDESAATFLRHVLLSEMEDEYAGTQSEGACAGGCKATREIQIAVASQREAGSNGGNRKDSLAQAYVESRNAEEMFGYVATNRAFAKKSRRERRRRNRTAAVAASRARQGMDSGILHLIGKKTGWLSDLLQSRSCISEEADCDRSGWPYAQEQKGGRREKGRQTGVVRVDRVEVLELGHPDLDRYRDAEGYVHFYDIESTRHPSYSVHGLTVHNSSILKNFNGKRKAEITEFMRRCPYRLLCTATAAPNDFDELGTSSEALGYLGYQDMLSRFFRQQTNKDHLGWGRTKYRLKGHAHDGFWRWVCSWSRSIRNPSDLGYSDDEFQLPGLNVEQHVVPCSIPRDGMLFVIPAVTMQEQRQERRMTIEGRCEKAAELISDSRSAVCWCHLNDEGDLLERIITHAEQISGKDNDDEKEDKLKAFSRGDIPYLITKSKIAGWGLNWQHCHHMTTFPSHSFEQYYQSVRRLYRFGQKHPVQVDIITTPGEECVITNLTRKQEQADKMFARLVAHMNDALHLVSGESFSIEERLPAWL